MKSSTRSQRRWVLQTGFLMLLLLLIACAWWAYKIQQSFSEEAATIYHGHLRQDESLLNLRRTLWQSSILVRDFLLDTATNREAAFRSLLSGFQRESWKWLDALETNPVPGQDSTRIRKKLDDYWAALEAVPASTSGLTPGERHRFVLSEIAPRRVAMTELLLELTRLGGIELENNEQRLRDTRQLASRQLLRLLCAALLTGMLFAALSLRRLARLEAQTARQYDELARTSTEMQALSAQLMVIQEAERSRLSRELHDEIGQALATLRLELSRLESSVRPGLPDIHRRLARAREIVDTTVRSVRSIALMLRPSLLDDLGLVAALQWLAEDFTRRTGIPCRILDQEVSEQLPDEHRTCAYRLVQEALHNVEKHAEASRVEIGIRQDGAGLEVSVQDNGKGFSTPHPRRMPGSQLGILGMRERVTAIGGRFSIDALEGRGTRLDAWLPLAQIEPKPAGQEV